METWCKVLHTGHMAQVPQTEQGGNKLPGLGHGLELATEQTTWGKVVATDLTVVGYGNVWNLVQENEYESSRTAE